jgi:hypothetical protein
LLVAWVQDDQPVSSGLALPQNPESERKIDLADAFPASQKQGVV